MYSEPGDTDQVLFPSVNYCVKCIRLNKGPPANESLSIKYIGLLQ